MDVIHRIQEAFVEHLMLDRGENVLKAKRNAADICERELAASQSMEAGGFYSILLESQRIGILWNSERGSVTRTWHLLYIEIQASHRGKGIAKAAMTEFISLAKAEKVSAITLNVSPRNQSALSLYKKLGFLPMSGRYILNLD